MDLMDTMGMIAMLLFFVPICGIALAVSIVLLIVDIVRGDRLEDKCQNCKYRMMYNDKWVCMNEKSGAYKQEIKPEGYCGAYLWINAKLKRP